MKYLIDNPKPLELRLIKKIVNSFDGKDENEKMIIIDKITSRYAALNFSTKVGIEFFRARNIDSQIFNCYQDILWPPNNYSANNRFGNNFFYVASSMHTALAETDNNERNKVLLSVFIQKEGKELRMFPVGEVSQIVKGIHGHFTTRDKMTSFSIALNKSMGKDEDQTLSYIIQDAFLYKQLLSNNQKIATYTINSILNNSAQDYDIIGYPSVKNKGGYNYSIRLDKFHDNFEVAWASQMEVVHIYDSFYKTYTNSVLKSYDDDSLNWEKKTTNDDNIIYFLHKRIREMYSSVLN